MKSKVIAKRHYPTLSTKKDTPFDAWMLDEAVHLLAKPLAETIEDEVDLRGQIARAAWDAAMKHAGKGRK